MTATKIKSSRRGRPRKIDSGTKKPAKLATTSVMFAGEASVEKEEEVKKPVEAPPVADPFAFLSELPQIKKYAETLIARMGVDKEDLLRSLFVKTWKESKTQISESAMARHLNELLDRAKRGLRL